MVQEEREHVRIRRQGGSGGVWYSERIEGCQERVRRGGELDGLQARLGVVESRCVALENEILAVWARRSSEVGGVSRLVGITERLSSELTRSQTQLMQT